MNPNNTAKRNDFSQVSTVIKAPPETAGRECRDEIKKIVKELHKLLPRYRMHVEPAWYRLSRDEVMRLTDYACDDSLDIFTQASLLHHLRGHRQMFVTALADAA